MVGHNQILGIFIPGKNNTISFILVNAGFGNMSVSSSSMHSDNARSALFSQYTDAISLRDVLMDAGANLTDGYDGYEIDLDLMPQNLTKDTFIKLLSPA